MPHYHDGSESKVGDIVKTAGVRKVPILGTVVSRRPGEKPDMIVMETRLVHVWGHEMELVARPE